MRIAGRSDYASGTEGIRRLYWVIIATILDLRTGQPLDQGRLEGRELEFDDPVKCQSVVGRIRPIEAAEMIPVSPPHEREQARLRQVQSCG